MTVHHAASTTEAGGLNVLLEATTADPRVLHDALRTVVSGIEAAQQPVPVELRRALEELEADIAEAYFNNVPV